MRDIAKVAGSGQRSTRLGYRDWRWGDRYDARFSYSLDLMKDRRARRNAATSFTYPHHLQYHHAARTSFLIYSLALIAIAGAVFSYGRGGGPAMVSS
jgi:hypothetical protein